MAQTELTIASGAITVNANHYNVDTEGDAASDDLDTITAGSEVADGFLLVLRPNNAARTVVIKHNTGNILCANGVDITLDDAEDQCFLMYDSSLTKWRAGWPLAGITAAMIANRTRTFFVQTAYGDGTEIEYGYSHADGATRTSYARFSVPEDFVSDMTVAPVVICPTGSGNNIRWNSTCSYGANNQSYAAHTASVGNTTTAIAVDLRRYVLSAASLTDAALNDQVLASFTRFGADAADTLAVSIYCMGFLVSYTADS